MAWTEKMVEDLKVMWKQGLTTGEIGKRLGVSKNSIVGKVHRLQLDARPSPIKKKEPEEVKETKKEKKSCKTKSTEKTVEELKTEEKVVEKNVKRAVEKVVEKTPEPVIEEAKTFTPKLVTPAKTYNGNAKLTDLDNHTCRWPIGDPKDENFHFCGRKIKLGQTYCEEHAALAYVKPNNKK